MAVDDHGLEVLKKSGEQVTPGDKSDMYVKTDAVNNGVLIAKLQEILNAVDGLEGFTDGLESLATTTNTLLTTIRDNADQLEGYTDGIEGLITSTNTLLTSISGYVDQLEGYTDGIEGLLTDIKGYTDQLEGYLDQVEGYLASIDGKMTTHPWVNAVASKNFMAGTNQQTVPTNAETPFMLIKNPSGSGKTLQVYKLIMGLLFNNQNGVFRLYANPTITANGTALAIVNQRIKSSPTASVMNAYVFPTTSANGTLMNQFPVQQNGSPYTLTADDLIVIEANNAILITVDNAANNMPAMAGASWMEV